MRLWTGLVRRRVGYMALVLVTVVLAGVTPLHGVQGQTEVLRIAVSFSPSTPPIEPGVICKDQDYQIVVRPMLSFESVGVGGTLQFGSISPLNQPSLGTLNGSNGPSISSANGGLAVFTYRARETGQEILSFGWGDLAPPRPGLNLSWDDIGALGFQRDTEFSFEVRECKYNVIFESSYTFSQGGVVASNFGLTAETRLERKEDGTFAGNGTFVISNLVTSKACIATYSDAEIPVAITGNIREGTTQLDLTFAYQKGKYITDATCVGGPRSASATTTTALDVSGIAPGRMTVPRSGGTEWFLLPGPGGGYLKITVKQVTQQ